MSDKFFDITVGLAGMIQSISLAREFAHTGNIKNEAYETCIYSIFQTDPKDVADVYGGINRLQLGLEKLIDLFTPAFTANNTNMRYLVSLIQMQKKIMRNNQIRIHLANRIQQIKKQTTYFPVTHTTVIANLADIYLDAISAFNFRILLWGNQRILRVSENMDKIRVLLLAGIRATVLWRQVGGSRLHLLFARHKLKTMANTMLQEINKAALPGIICTKG